MSRLAVALSEEYSEKLRLIAEYNKSDVYKIIVEAIDIMYCVLIADGEIEDDGIPIIN